MSCWNLWKQSILIWIEFWVNNNQNTNKANTSWFCCMKMHQHTKQKRYRKRLNSLELAHPITTSLQRYDTHLLSSALLFTKIYENGSMTGLPEKSKSSFDAESKNYQKDGEKSIDSNAPYFEYVTLVSYLHTWSSKFSCRVK